MYIRSAVKKVKGKVYRYWKLVESVRTEKGVKQQVIAHLGNLDQFTAQDWKRLAEQMGDQRIVTNLQQRIKEGPRRGRPRSWYLQTPEQKGIDLSIKLSSVGLKKDKDFGDVFVGLQIWKMLGLGKLMQELLVENDIDIPFHFTAAIIAVNRMVSPCSELAMVRWFPRTALPSLLGIPASSFNEDRLYRTLDKVVKHKQEIETYVSRQGEILFERDYSFLLYDMTSTYFEGQAKNNPKAKRGYSRDKRPDCLQVCIGVVVDRSGFPLGYEIEEGNKKDSSTVIPTLEKLEKRFGRPNTKPLLCMDRGMINEETQKELQSRQYRYIIAERREEARKWWDKAKKNKWETIRSTPSGEILVEVQEVGKSKEDRIILVRSAGCKEKERGIHGRLLKRMVEDLKRLKDRIEKGKLKNPIKIERAIGRIEARHPGVNRWMNIEFLVDKPILKWEMKTGVEELAKEVEGVYTLRTNVKESSTGQTWEDYIQLTQVEKTFRTLKHSLNIRPVFHHKEKRVEAHILFSFLAYTMMWTLEHLHRSHDGTLTGPRLLEYLHEIKLGTIRMTTTTGLSLSVERICDRSQEQDEILSTLGIQIPEVKTNLASISLTL